ANGVTSNQIWYYPWSQGSSVMAWNTYNPVTMSQGKTTLQYNYAYDATSGTVFTDDSKSGSAAQIRTVGWGGGNTASGSLPTSGNRWKFGTCKYVSAGQLFLGNWENVNPEQNAIPNYGIDFASRPSSMTFWYKYAVMNRNGNDNGQKGVAIIQILDGNGNIISEKTELLDVNASYNNLSADTDYSVGGVYAEKTIPLEYPINAYKASRIVVTFKSSQLTNSELENLKNQDNMRPPRPMNLNNHEYLGSSLLIDDITLNY
ncbi:MAG: PCMD domain-containing protein, partial [Muribaculaceae bacterium]|nr:PCMD domain-containing protein [Muribaculaceae bacterium]